jgi:hypothetical protein
MKTPRSRAGEKRTAWSDAEKALMTQHYIARGAVFLAAQLPGRTLIAIHQQAKVMGLKTQSECWTAEQDELIRQHLPSAGAVAVSAMVGRTPGAVRARASRLKVRAERPIRRKERSPRVPAPTVLRKAAKQKAEPQPLQGEARITSATRVTIAPAFVDRRFVPTGPVPRVVDSAQCRDWAREAAA